MGEKSRLESLNLRFEHERSIFQKWVPVFQHLGLKPRRFVNEADAVYVCTAAGWFRLSLVKYRKEELNWLRSILSYLEERSFNNWAVTWRKTIIWEENNSCYLIQPWLLNSERFQTTDPAALNRLAEILAELYRCGKDYRENRGIQVFRDRWSATEAAWKAELEMVQSFKEDQVHEKVRKEISGLRKTAENLLAECIKNWESGIKALFDHHFQLGVLGHGELRAKYVVWRGHDYYLLNWENLSFQPKIMDLAAFINDLSFWEPEWIIYFINQYSKLQPLWPEEYYGLKAMLQYPGRLIELLQAKQLKELDHKQIKEVEKDLKRKGRCLDKVWRELGSEKTNWAWQKELTLPRRRQSGKISLALSPVETWGGLTNEPGDSLIHVTSEQKLPSDIWRRLVNLEQDRVLDGQDSGIMEAGSDAGSEADFMEIGERPSRNSQGSDFEPENAAEIKQPSTGKESPDTVKRQTTTSESSSKVPENQVISPQPQSEPAVLNWSNFPKSLLRGKQR